MNMQNGTISDWNEEKGFGFITPKSGRPTIFFHINAYSRSHERPKRGLEVQYSHSSDAQGRKCAINVSPLKGVPSYRNGNKQKLISILLSGTFAWVLFHLYHSRLIALELVGLYACMNAIAFFMYAKDKRAAEWGAWRTSESTLHTLSLLGGWPGAAMAQAFLRHKSKKVSFRATYWVTVVANCCALYWLVTPRGRMWLNTILENL